MNGETSRFLEIAPSFRSTALALPLFPGSCMRKPFTHNNPETPMPLAFAPPLPPNPFRLAPATHPAPAPFTLLPDDQHRPSFRHCTPDSPHALASLSPPVSADRFLGFGLSSAGVWTRCSGVRKALTSSVLVNSAWGFGWSSAGIPALGSGALKALSHSVLVKRIAPALVHGAAAFDQRVEVQCWPGSGSAKRALGLGSAVVGEIRLARQMVLVRSFSSACNAPLHPSCDPGAGSGLNGLGVSHA
jgi:hypothetical protein